MAPGTRERALRDLAGRDGSSRRRFIADRSGVEGMGMLSAWAVDPVRSTNDADKPHDNPEIAVDIGIPDGLRWVEQALTSMMRQHPLRALVLHAEFTVAASQAVKARMVAEKYGGSLTLRQYRYELGKALDWFRGRAAADKRDGDMSKDVEGDQGSREIKLAPTGPWKRFWRLVTEPWTFILLLASLGLFAIGQQKLEPSVTALVQILLAVSSGVLGARVTNLLETASGKSILEARGKVAVRGLKLMLVQTAAFQRRVQRFIDNRQHIEANPDVTVRNYEEAVEFCRRIQEEAASAMETWGDVVPTADLSSLIGRITEAEEQRDASKRELELARAEAEAAAGNANEAQRMREKIEILERQARKSEDRVRDLTKKLETPVAVRLTGSDLDRYSALASYPTFDELKRSILGGTATEFTPKQIQALADKWRSEQQASSSDP